MSLVDVIASLGAIVYSTPVSPDLPPVRRGLIIVARVLLGRIRCPALLPLLHVSTASFEFAMPDIQPREDARRLASYRVESQFTTDQSLQRRHRRGGHDPRVGPLGFQWLLLG